jgi:hypothetical protein
MQNIIFDCPVCGQNLDAPLKMAGMMIRCPACGALTDIPAPADAQRLRIGEQAKKATTRIIGSLGGLPPNPKQRRMVIKRPSGK